MNSKLERWTCFRAWPFRGSLLLILFACGVAVGQEKIQKANEEPPQTSQPEQRPTAKTHPNDPMIWDIERMMEDAVMQIVRRYNLNPSQEEYTRLLLTKRVREFLDEHEDDVRALLHESIQMRQNKSARDTDSLRMWADRAGPIYDAAKEAILGGNMEWAEILDEDQLKIHDGDMTKMKANFKNVTRTLVQWQEGKGSWPGRPRPKSGGNDVQTVDGRVSTPVKSVIAKIEDNWLAYVNIFIRAYHLDKTQQNSAREKVHKEQLAKATKYREKNKAGFDKNRAEMKSKDGKSRMAELRKEKRRLEQPIRRIFVDMDRRLKKLRRSDQIANVDPIQKKTLDTWRRTLSGQGPTKLKAPKPEAKTEAAKTDAAKPSKETKAPEEAKDKEPAASESTESAPPKKAKADPDKPKADDAGATQKKAPAESKKAEPAKPESDS